MYTNELLFGIYTVFISFWALGALFLGKEALVALMTVQWVLANLFVTKQIALVGFEATASDTLAIGAALCLNLLQEYYGKNQARKAIWIGFCGLLFFVFAALMHQLYIPSTFDTSQVYFQALLSPMPRLLFASLIVYLIVQYLESFLYAFFQEKFKSKRFLLRNYISLLISQFVDTVLFSFLGLYGILENIGDIIIVSYTIKVAVIFLAAPFLALANKFMHQA
jgi:uncharacterized integral membrane protein (TIGR00697 family)